MARALFFLLIAAAAVPSAADCQTIAGPEVRLAASDIMVSFSLSLDDKHLQGIRDGMEKEYVFYIDLFRVWNNWPDEFVLGKSSTRTLKADPVKKEFVATDNDGSVRTKKRFKSFASMADWTLSVRDLKLSSSRELEPGQYYVKITAESKIRKLPPVIKGIFIFLPENEFRLQSSSAMFRIEGSR